jgi:hypothetical protein
MFRWEEQRIRTMRVASFCGVLCSLAGAACAQSPVLLTIANSPGYAIPADFNGLSFETGSERSGNARTSGYMFSATNTELITLFQNIGLRNIRMGGGTVDDQTPPGLGKEGYAGIDNLFAFARQAGVKVIYSLRLPGSATMNYAASDAAIAHYIWVHYQPLLACFAIGNEPDWKSYRYPPFGAGHDPAITNYPSYLADWERFATAINRAVPGATFAGPDTGSYSTSTYYHGQSWTQRFAEEEKNSGIVTLITQHLYVGAQPRVPGKKTLLSAGQAIDNMLSPGWDTITNQWLYDHNLAPVVAVGLPYRLTESNDYLGGVTNASDAFAAALWTLDYLHWWAAHKCAGVNFHNKQWIRTDTICRDTAGNYQISPKAYGIKAFDLGGHGQVEPLTLANTDGLDLTAYAVGSATNLYVTIINKEHGPGARAAAVDIVAGGFPSGSAVALFLTGPAGDLTATKGITLGGAPITNQAPWQGQWAALNPPANGEWAVTVPAGSAAIIKIMAL